MNSAITEALACLFATIAMVRYTNSILAAFKEFLSYRAIPVPPWSLVYVIYGFCQFFGSTGCYGGCMILMHLYTHSSLSLLMSFFYRYYVLIK